MREIKFRAWDKVVKKMFFRTLEEMAQDGWIPKDGWDLFSEPMQYTGLKDKNGKEIYEGDIVKTDNEYYPTMFVTYTADITNEHDGDWDEWYCGFDLAVPDDECKVLHYQLDDGVEVIGNIYKNPELLEGKK